MFIISSFRDEMGGGESLSQYAKDNLIKELNERSFCNVFIACIDGMFNRPSAIQSCCVISHESCFDGQISHDLCHNDITQYYGDFSIKLFVFIATLDKPVGLATTFEGFSTFAAKPLINIHDIAVLPEYRGKGTVCLHVCRLLFMFHFHICLHAIGVGQVLLQEVEDFARSRGCCKLTLEVLQGNIIAQKAYSKFGFAGYELGDGLGHAMFWQKKLK